MANALNLEMLLYGPRQPFSKNHPAGRAAAGAVVTDTPAARRMPTLL